MQTRAAARRLAAAAEAARSAVGTPSQPTTLTQPSETANDPSPAHNPEPVGKATRGSKRTRSGKKKAPPVKGGWALPHGMGVGVAKQDDGSSLKTEETPLVLGSIGLSSTPVAGQIRDNSPTDSQSSTKQDVPRRTRQTRLSLRVTKAGLTNRNSLPKEDKPNVSLQEVDNPSIKQEDGRPSKRARTARLAAGQTVDSPATTRATLAPALAETEKDQTTEPTTLKLLVFRGVTFQDGMFAKSSDKIIVDASKFLDPNFKRIVKRGKENPYGLTPGLSPYPYRRVPTPEACEEVHRILSEFHGEVKQPEKMPSASLEVAGCGEVPCVLDALLRTLISGNTLMAMADAAIKNLAQHYGLRTEGTGAGSINWDKVRLSSHQELVEVIKIAGNGPKKARHIKQILDMVYEENLQRAQGRPSLTKANPIQRGDGTCVATQNLLSLDHMHRMSKDEAMAKFVSYPGIGIKTAACVTLFCLRMPCFAVDTHVHKFCRWLGWVPAKADPDNCFRHGEVMVPDHLKYGLHQLFIRHGQQCFKCRKVTKPGTKEWDEAPDCPLEHLLDRSKDEAAAKPKRNGKVKEESDSEDASSGMED